MKRILLEILLVLGIGGAGYYGWSQSKAFQGADGQLQALTEQVAASEEKLKDAEKAQAEQDEKLKALAPKAQQFDAVQGAFSGGQVLGDLEALYAKQKSLSSERQLGLGVVRLLTKGPQDEGALQAFQKTLEQLDWKNNQKIICATQNALAVAGKEVKVLAECNTPPPLPVPAAAAAADKAAGDKAEKKSGHGGHAHWDYEGEMGPEHWGKEFPTCAKGKAQAPLNIAGPLERSQSVLTPSYKSGALEVTHNGHTIQVKGTAESKLRVDSKPYELVQFHFHKPSEEQIDGKPMAMVIHFVHKSEEGNLVVLGVLVKEGNENPGIQTIWQHMPTEPGTQLAEGVRFNPGNLLPREKDFWSYEGSLTTPPCTEGVRFFILKTPINMSRAQIAQFPFKKNARPVQPLNGRMIQSN